jgi:hypothetical protein
MNGPDYPDHHSGWPLVVVELGCWWSWKLRANLAQLGWYMPPKREWSGGDGALSVTRPEYAPRINLAVIAKTSPDRLGTYARERGWGDNIRLLSSRHNTFNRDYHAETPEGEQLPVLSAFSRDDDGIHHRWASELTFVIGGDTSSLDPVWPIWGALDVTPEGRGDVADYPSLQYE